MIKPAASNSVFRDAAGYHRGMSVTPDVASQARARKIKVLLFDVDGVLTDGQIFVVPESSAPDAKGLEVKGFSAHDGLGITLARLAGLKIGIITKRQSRTVALRASDLKIEFVYQGQSRKMTAVEEILARAQVTMDEVAYVGDDIVDLGVMRVCGLAIAPANAREQVKAVAHYITPHAGGHGAGRDAVDFILNAQGVLSRVIEEFLEADNPAVAAADVGSGGM
jgi:3-deoxy-D-manno-octulosonate 8-phosphate phosphatase (KDO 8-P phosphatase)